MRIGIPEAQLVFQNSEIALTAFLLSISEVVGLKTDPSASLQVTSGNYG